VRTRPAFLVKRKEGRGSNEKLLLELRYDGGEHSTKRLLLGFTVVKVEVGEYTAGHRQHVFNNRGAGRVEVRS
jgi:hypothetical protein